MPEGNMKAKVLFEATCKRCGKGRIEKSYVVN